MMSVPDREAVRAALRLAENSGGVARLLAEMLAAVMGTAMPSERSSAWRRRQDAA